MSQKHVKSCCFLFWSLFLTAWVGAGSDHPTREKTTPQTVQTCGEGVILKGDQVSAKRLALLDARTRAIEKVAGVTLDSSTVLQNELIVESLLTMESQGHISHESILSETAQGDLFKVCIEAHVSRGKARSELKSLVGQTRIVVLSKEIRDGAIAPKNTIAQTLKQALLEQNFTVVDELSFLSQWHLTHQGSDPTKGEQIQDFAQALFAGFVVIVEAETIQVDNEKGVQPYNMGELSKAKTATAFGSIRVFHGDTSLLIAEKNFDRIAGFDLSTQDGASEKALLKAGQICSPWLVNELSVYLKKGQRKIDLIFNQLHQKDRLEQIVSLLQLHRWASDVNLESSNPNAASRITLAYADNTVYLANFLEKQTLPGGFQLPRASKRGPNLLVFDIKP